MSDVALLSKTLDILRDTKRKHVAVAGLAIGAIALIMFAIKKGFNLEVKWKDGSLKLLMNNGKGT